MLPNLIPMTNFDAMNLSEREYTHILTGLFYQKRFLQDYQTYVKMDVEGRFKKSFVAQIEGDSDEIEALYSKVWKEMTSPDSASSSAWSSNMAAAPRDGTPIDLWYERAGRVADAYWGRPHHSCGEYGQYCDSCPRTDEWCSFGDYITFDEGSDEASEQPKYWRPIELPSSGSPT